MKNILLIGATFSKNKGSSAMLISTIRSIKKAHSDALITVLTMFADSDYKSGPKYGVQVVGYTPGLFYFLSQFPAALTWKLLDSFGQSIDLLNNAQLLRNYLNADIIVDLSGDGFTDDYGLMETLASCWDIILCKLLNKPIVIFAQSIGPFNNKITRQVSKCCLDKVDLLMVREEITEKYLLDIGVTNQIHLTADSAFLLDPAPEEKIAEILLKYNINTDHRPIIGLSVSQLIFEMNQNRIKGSNSENSYVSLMANTANYLIDKFDAQLVFVPHVTNDDTLAIDDRFVANRIYDQITLKDKVKLINEDYSPEELKGVIGKCDLFIGARMHANIAATSMCVPTLAIAYSHKFYGIMKMLQLDEYVMDYKNMTYEELIARIECLWNDRNSVIQTLNKNTKKIREKAICNTTLLSKL